MKRDISGKQRKLISFIQPFEQMVLRRYIPKVPAWLQTYHLTLFTVPFSVAVIGLGYLARGNTFWLVFISVFVFAQYVSDILDGAVGRYRNTGLVLWGFYMDHFMDYLFACSLVASYTIAYQLSTEFFFSAMFVTSSIFVHEFLMCIAEGKLNTSGYYGFGPTEIRMTIIFGNFLLPFIPREFIQPILTVLVPFSLGVTIWLVFNAQRKLWAADMRVKIQQKVNKS